MLTIMIQAQVKEEYIDEFVALASQLTRETRGKRIGCIAYSFNQRTDSPTEFVLYEQWQTQQDLDNHIQALIELLGPPKPGGLLPAKLVNMYKSATPYFYTEID